MPDQKVTHKPSFLHTLGLHPARNLQPIKPPQLLLMTQHQRDEFRRRQDTLAKHMNHSQNADAADKADKKEKPETPLTNLLSQKKGGFWHLANQRDGKKTPTNSPKGSNASSGSTSPSDDEDQRITADYLLSLPPAALMSVLNKMSPIPSVASEASLDSFVHVGSSSKASSSHGDSHEVRSLPDSMPGSPWLSLPGSPFMSKTHSHLRLTQAALEPKHEHPVHEDSDSDDETVEQSTATLKA